MQTSITNRTVNSVEPKEKPFEIRDTTLKGLILRVQPSGSMSYYLEYGRGKRVKVGRADAITPVEARGLARSILAKSYDGKDPAADRRESKEYTLESYLDEVYQPWADAHIRTSKATVQRTKKAFSTFLKKNMDEITPWLVEKWRSERLKKGIKASTVNRELTDLKSMLAKAVQWGLLKTHPLAGVKRCKVDSSGSIRFLSPAEENKLREALDDREKKIRNGRTSGNLWLEDRGRALRPSYEGKQFVDHLKPMVILAMNTGLRRGELFNLQWSDVDLTQLNLTVRGDGAKSGQTRHIPLNKETIEVLTGWKAQANDLDGLVFPSDGGKPFDNIRKSWANLIKDANKKGVDLSDFRFHDLRHHFASRLAMSGVDLNTIRELLGHSDYSLTLRYSHLAPEHKMAAVQKLTKTYAQSASKPLQKRRHAQ